MTSGRCVLSRECRTCVVMEFDLEAEKQEILRRYRGLLRAAKNSKKRSERKAIRKAFDVALDAHKDIRRKSGEPYIYHPIAVARVVAEEMGLGTTSIVCARAATSHGSPQPM